MDARSNFWQIGMAPKDIFKIAFICEFGLYEWVRMP